MEKGKNKQLTELVDLEDKELETRVEDINVDETRLILHLPLYTLSRKLIAKVIKSPNALQFSSCTPLLPKDVPFEGAFVMLLTCK